MNGASLGECPSRTERSGFEARPQASNPAAYWASASLATNTFIALERRDARTSGLRAQSLLDVLDAFDRITRDGTRPFLREGLITTARALTAALSNIVVRPRFQLVRTHELVPVERVREFDGRTIVWLARRPGHGARERLAGVRRMPAVVRVVDYATLENRVTRRVARDVVKAIAQRLESVAHFDDDAQRAEHVAALKYCHAVCERVHKSPLGEVRPEPRPQTNNVLRSDPVYAKIWRGWTWLADRETAAKATWNNGLERIAAVLFWRLVADIRVRLSGIVFDTVVDVVGEQPDRRFGILVSGGDKPPEVPIFVPSQSGAKGAHLTLGFAGCGVVIKRRAHRLDRRCDAVEIFDLTLSSAERACEHGRLYPMAYAIGRGEAVLREGTWFADLAGFREVSRDVLSIIGGLVAEDRPSRTPPTTQGREAHVIGWDAAATDTRIVAGYFAQHPENPLVDELRPMGGPQIPSLPFALALRAPGGGALELVGRRGHSYDFRHSLENRNQPSTLAAVFEGDTAWTEVGDRMRRIVTETRAFLDRSGRAEIGFAIPDELSELAQIRLHRLFRNGGRKPWFIWRSVAAVLGYEAQRPQEVEKLQAGDVVLVVDAEGRAITVTPLVRQRDEETSKPLWERDLRRAPLVGPEELSYRALLGDAFRGALAETVDRDRLEQLPIEAWLNTGLAQRWFDGEEVTLEIADTTDATCGWVTLKGGTARQTALSNWRERLRSWFGEWRAADALNAARDAIRQGRQLRVLFAGHPFDRLNMAQFYAELRAEGKAPFADPVRSKTEVWRPKRPQSLVSVGGFTFVGRRLEPTYRDKLPDLRLETPERPDGIELFNAVTVRPGESVDVRLEAPLELPAGVEFVVFPLLRASGDREPLGYDAIVTSPVFPLSEPVQVELRAKYLYGADGFRVVVTPTEKPAPFATLEVRWVRSGEADPQIRLSRPPPIPFPSSPSTVALAALGRLRFHYERLFEVSYRVCQQPAPGAAEIESARLPLRNLRQETSKIWNGVSECGVLSQAIPVFAGLAGLLRTWATGCDIVAYGPRMPEFEEARFEAFGALASLGPDLPDTLGSALVEAFRTDRLVRLPLLGRAILHGAHGFRAELLRLTCAVLKDRLDQLPTEQQQLELRLGNVASEKEAAGRVQFLLNPIKALATAAWSHPGFTRNLVAAGYAELALRAVDAGLEFCSHIFRSEELPSTFRADVLRRGPGATFAAICDLLMALIREDALPELAMLQFGSKYARRLAREVRLLNYSFVQNAVEPIWAARYRGAQVRLPTLVSGFLVGDIAKNQIRISIEDVDASDEES